MIIGYLDSQGELRKQNVSSEPSRMEAPCIPHVLLSNLDELLCSNFVSSHLPFDFLLLAYYGGY